MDENEIDRMKRLCSKLLREVQLLTPDRADSNISEWEEEADQLGIKPYDWWEHPHIT